MIRPVIYRITNTINGKAYIGQTRQALKSRWNNHLCCRSEHPLYRAMNKYGRENFSISVVCSALKPENLNALEEYFIEELNTLKPTGYNILAGGNASLGLPQEVRDKISASLKANPQIIANLKLHRWTKGNNSPPSDETRSKIRTKLKGKPIKNRWSKGNLNPCKVETKAKIRATMLGQPQPWKYKPITCVELGRNFPSVQSAAKELNIPRTMISTCLRTQKPHKNGGYRFIFSFPASPLSYGTSL